MILAQSPLLPLSGNNLYILLILGTCLAACSPKIQPVERKPLPEVKEDIKDDVKPTKKFTEANITLLMPFKLNEINLKSEVKAEVEKASMAINFYQGFRLGVDSAAAMGLNFKINVYDTRDNNTQISGLIKNNSLKESNLIVGPVYPDGLKYITKYSIENNLPIISPLAASHPNEFNNPNLISVVNNIDLHASKIGDYISLKYKPENVIVVLINPKNPDDNLLGIPLSDYFLKGKGSRFTFHEYSSIFTMETKMLKNKNYVILVSSAEKSFVNATIDKLLRMKKAGLSVDLYGHPNWIRQNYNTDKLQALNTYVTSSYYVDYKNQAVIEFIKRYRRLYQFEPDEYSFKGFDTGLYFGKLLAQYGTDFVKHITKEKYKGIQNSYSFLLDQNTGFINTSLMLLKYSNYSLYPIK